MDHVCSIWLIAAFYGHRRWAQLACRRSYATQPIHRSPRPNPPALLWFWTCLKTSTGRPTGTTSWRTSRSTWSSHTHQFASAQVFVRCSVSEPFRSQNWDNRVRPTNMSSSFRDSLCGEETISRTGTSPSSFRLSFFGFSCEQRVQHNEHLQRRNMRPADSRASLHYSLPHSLILEMCLCCSGTNISGCKASGQTHSCWMCLS